MIHSTLKSFVGVVGILLPFLVAAGAAAASLTVELGKAQGVTFVGAIQRWDQDGNHRRLPTPRRRSTLRSSMPRPSTPAAVAGCSRSSRRASTIW